MSDEPREPSDETGETRTLPAASRETAAPDLRSMPATGGTMPEPTTSARPLSQALPGTWRLTSRIDRTSTGEIHDDPALGSDAMALLVYDRAGHFAAQFMKRDRSGAAVAGLANAGNNTQAQGGYDAYFGSYSVDDTTGVVTQRLEGSLSPGNVGMVLSRAMTVTGNRLVIVLETKAVDGTPVTRTLTWERVG